MLRNNGVAPVAVLTSEAVQTLNCQRRASCWKKWRRDDVEHQRGTVCRRSWRMHHWLLDSSPAS